jgi:hypothetical protein
MASVNSDDDASDDDRYISDDEDPVSGEDGADDMSDDEDAASASANASAPRGVAAAHGARPAAAEEKFGKATPWMLPSLFKGRPATIWIPYAPFLGKVREAGLDRVEELTDSRVLPLRFACETQINCVVSVARAPVIARAHGLAPERDARARVHNPTRRPAVHRHAPAITRASPFRNDDMRRSISAVRRSAGANAQARRLQAAAQGNQVRARRAAAGWTGGGAGSIRSRRAARLHTSTRGWVTRS